MPRSASSAPIPLQPYCTCRKHKESGGRDGALNSRNFLRASFPSFRILATALGSTHEHIWRRNVYAPRNSKASDFPNHSRGTATVGQGLPNISIKLLLQGSLAGERRRSALACWCLGRRLDVAKIKDLPSRASTCSKTLVAEGQKCVHECCARFRHACIRDIVFNIRTEGRPDQLHLPHLFFVPLLGRETIPEVKERRPQDGRCESPTAEE